MDTFDVDAIYLVRQKEPMDEQTPNRQTYAQLLAAIKERIQSAQVRSAVAVNQELVLLYWGIGREIIARQQEEGWGAKIIDQLVFRFSWKWRRRSPVKVKERTYEEAPETLHAGGEGRYPCFRSSAQLSRDEGSFSPEP